MEFVKCLCPSEETPWLVSGDFNEILKDDEKWGDISDLLVN